MDILEYFASPDQPHWLAEIRECDWSAGQFLHTLLSQNRLRELCGPRTRVFLLTDGPRLAGFCTLAERDDIPETPLGPWIGFVYTFPAYRGRRLAGRLLAHACEAALRDGAASVYISTQEIGLYERYGFAFLQEERNLRGEPSRVYGKALRGVLRADASQLEPLSRLMLALWPSHTQEALLCEARELLQNPECACFLAMENGRAVGFAQAQLRHDYVEGTSTSPVGYLEGVFVEEASRGRGHASALLRACEAWARGMGCAEFASDCELDNAQSLAFHLRAGFAEASRNIHFAKRL